MSKLGDSATAELSQVGSSQASQGIPWPVPRNCKSCCKCFPDSMGDFLGRWMSKWPTSAPLRCYDSARVAWSNHMNQLVVSPTVYPLYTKDNDIPIKWRTTPMWQSILIDPSLINPLPFWNSDPLNFVVGRMVPRVHSYWIAAQTKLDLTMFPQTIYFQMAICYPMIVRESVELLIIQVDKNPRSSKIFVAPSLSSSFITHSVPRAELHLSFSRPQDMWNTSPIHLRV